MASAVITPPPLYKLVEVDCTCGCAQCVIGAHCFRSPKKPCRRLAKPAATQRDDAKPSSKTQK